MYASSPNYFTFYSQIAKKVITYCTIHKKMQFLKIHQNFYIILKNKMSTLKINSFSANLSYWL